MGLTESFFSKKIAQGRIVVVASKTLQPWCCFGLGDS